MLDRSEMARLTEGAPSKSEKMRILARAGYSRAAIAQFLDVRYQFVRNVLLREAERHAQELRREQPPTDVPGGSSNRVRVDGNGQIVLPDNARTALGIKPGDTLLVSIEDDEIRLMTIPSAVRKVQAIVRQYVPEGVSLVDELLEDRRREVERESRE